MTLSSTARSLLGCVVLALLLNVPVAHAADRSDDSLADLDLEELLDAQLDGMGITSIHHTHDAGEWMIGHSYTLMHMDGNRSGTKRVSDDAVLRDYMVAPEDMMMKMHMLHAMYAPTDTWTIMGMIPYLQLSMDHKTRTGAKFTTRSKGFGDLKLGPLFSVHRGETNRVVVQGLVSLPTGHIRKKDDTPMGRVRLPYPMQLGSGTFDFLPGVTYLGQTERWQWGAHAAANLRTGRNSSQYRLGHGVGASAWISRKLLRFVSTSLRFDGRSWGNVRGADPHLAVGMVPTADPHLRGGRRVDVLLGLNLFLLEGPLAGNRLAVEGGVPLYQRLKGPQLETDYRLTFSWNWTF